jgi:hypothetical protein
MATVFQSECNSQTATIAVTPVERQLRAYTATVAAGSLQELAAAAGSPKYRAHSNLFRHRSTSVVLIAKAEKTASLYTTPSASIAQLLYGSER